MSCETVDGVWAPAEDVNHSRHANIIPKDCFMSDGDPSNIANCKRVAYKVKLFQLRREFGCIGI